MSFEKGIGRIETVISAILGGFGGYYFLCKGVINEEWKWVGDLSLWSEQMGTFYWYASDIIVMLALPVVGFLAWFYTAKGFFWVVHRVFKWIVQGFKETL